MAFQVTKMDLHIRETGKRHHTDDYENGNWVVRRGEPFEVTFNCSNFDPNTSNFQIHLKGGQNPSRRDGTWLVLNHTVGENVDYWFKILSKSSTQVKVEVYIPHDALVSAYDFSVVDLATRKEYPADRKLYVLFNPWNRMDEVYMEAPMDVSDPKYEYVLNDSGYVYQERRPKPWNFGQFTDAALKCTFKLLESAPSVSQRDSARDVARHISACGPFLIQGRWKKTFPGGRKPWEWSGSVAIFKKYLESEERVKYGQCWVFSGVTTSMMRCLGIPARSVTNIQSCHDRDRNCTNDVYFDENGYKIQHLSQEHPWNFHVWNDVWMARPDLPDGMSGWQAIDGTPQERSGGLYRCGPAPLKAIKEGNVNLAHDARFVFAEVNADTVHWQKDSTGQFKAVRIKPNSVGWGLLTKRPFQNATDDVMDQYKYKEGSAREREVMRRVMRAVGNPVVESQAEDIKFSSKAPWEVQMDEGITLTVNAENKDSKTFTIVARVTADVVSYDGNVLKTLEKQSQEKTVNRSESFEFKYNPIEFAEFYDDEISIRFAINARVKETNQVYTTEKVCKIERPQLKVELINGKDEVAEGDYVKVRIVVPKPPGGKRYTNPRLEMECPIWLSHRSDDIMRPLSEVTWVTSQEAESGVIERDLMVGHMEKSKTGNLSVTFNSDELSGLNGEVQLKYKAPSTLPPIDYGNSGETVSEWWDRFMASLLSDRH